MKEGLTLVGLCAFLSGPVLSQNTGTLKGKVSLAGQAEPIHGATIMVTPLGRHTETGDDGSYELSGLPPGSYTVNAHLHSFTDEAKAVTISAGEIAEVNFELQITVLRQQITVTASGREQTVFEAFQTVASLESVDLVKQSHTSLGEVLENQPGVAKRSFGPGSSRPVIRGFDGDRVLVMQDGMSTGTLSSQSGDHGESIDPLTLERLEVVKGPATLLYGSNALGGVVNAVTGHHMSHQHPHQGVRGYAAGVAGSANAQGGGGGGFEAGQGPWMIWGSGSGQRTGDYETPEGVVEDSRTRLANATAGFGWYGDRGFVDASYRYEDGRYGVPFAGEFEAGGGEGEDHADVSLDFNRHNARFSGGLLSLNNALAALRLALNYSDWQHRELEGEEVGTTFSNKQVAYRVTFEQAPTRHFSGSFGIQGAHRDYKTVGAEALTPPVNQNNFAAFALEEVGVERWRLQFGGRVEHNAYSPVGLPGRGFTGFSGGAGIQTPLWKGGAFVANYTHAFRSPALEELYNYGPHIGNLTFEIGNPDLEGERSNGVDLALRHQSRRVRAELNFFYYDISNFVFLSPTGEVEDGLRVAAYSQANSRFTGTEAGFEAGLHEMIWLNLGLDYVNAELKASGEPLPRIPPLRGRAGLEFRRGSFSVKPEVLMASAQDRIYSTETRTPGYAVVNVEASYTLVRQHTAHIFGFSLFNLGNRLYRNHLSFIKDLAPEIGRGVRLTYTLRFF